MKLSAKIENMTIADAVAILNDPDASGKFTWGEIVQIMELVERTQRIMSGQSGYDEIMSEVKKLRTRVVELENTIGKMRSVFGGDNYD